VEDYAKQRDDLVTRLEKEKRKLIKLEQEVYMMSPLNNAKGNMD
jgi:hypothetical protein